MYPKSKDYARLWELAREGKRIPCWLDYWENKGVRDIAEVKCYNGQVNAGVRGICYTDGITKEAFIKQCEQLNVEFIEPGPMVFYRVGRWDYDEWKQFGDYTDKEHAEKVAHAMRAKAYEHKLDIDPEFYQEGKRCFKVICYENEETTCEEEWETYQQEFIPFSSKGWMAYVLAEFKASAIKRALELKKEKESEAGE